MKTTSAIASLSLDLDNQWAYLRAAGKPDWEHAESYLPEVSRRIVHMLCELNLPITVFLVGRDLDAAANCDAIASFSSLKAWEPANHSFNHLPWLHTMSEEEIHDEIVLTEERIIDRFGRRPVGFRGPGFSCPPQVLRLLEERGYVYDASVFPTSVAPLARAVFLLKSGARGGNREKAGELYGSWSSLRLPNWPHLHTTAEGRLWEVPVTVMPMLRTPIHFSYLMFLASYSVKLAKAYFSAAIAACQRTSTPPSLLLHPTDFLGSDDTTKLSYFPGMCLPRATKLEVARWALALLADRFEVRCLIDQLKSLDPVIQQGLTAAPLWNESAAKVYPLGTVTR